MLTKNGTDDKKTQIQLISLDQLVPEDHLLRKIDKYIDFDFIYDLKAASRQSFCFLFYILYFQLQSSGTPYTFLYKSPCIRKNSSSSSGPPVVISRSGIAFRPSAIGGCI